MFCFASVGTKRLDASVVVCALGDGCVSVKQASALIELILFSVADSGYSTELKSVSRAVASPVETERSISQ